MDHIATVCSVYKGKHMEHLEEQDDDGDEENEEQSGNGEESKNISESDE